MSTLVTAVGMVLAVAVGTAALAALWAFLVRLGERESGRSKAVLPSHYASLLHTTPSNYPGYCPECGTNNDPEYELCRNCSARLPTRRERSSDDPERIFGS